MLSKVIKLNGRCNHIYQNSYRMFAAAAQPSDPLQKLFVDKIREYSQKSKSAANGLVDANQQTIKGLNEEMERVTRTFAIKDDKNLGTLNLKFEAEIKLDSINLSKE